MDAHLRLMDDVGIVKSYLSVSSPGVHFGDDCLARALAREVNQFAAAVRDRQPHRLGQFASLPLPDIEGALAEAAYALDVLGADGVTVQTNYQGSYLGSGCFEPLWAELDGRRAVVFVHPTSPPHADVVALGRPRPILEFLFDTARAASDLVFAGVLGRYPGIRWILTHAGGVLPLLADRVEAFRAVFPFGGPNVVDQLGSMWYDLAGTPFPRQVPALKAAFGLDRVLYGSDYCWTPPDMVRPHAQSVDELRARTTANAARLFTGRDSEDIA